MALPSGERRVVLREEPEEVLSASSRWASSPTELELAQPPARAEAKRLLFRRCCLPLAVLVTVVAGVAALAALSWGQGSRPLYNEGRAIKYARLAGAAYCSEEQLRAWNCGENCIEGVSSVHICPGDTTWAVVGVWEGMGLVSVKGTQTIASMVTDLELYKSLAQLNSCRNCMVHSGFLEEWTSMRPCVEETLNLNGFPPGSEVQITGHSLGAAIASIAMIDLHGGGWRIPEAYTFGMPRAGNEAFAQTFERIISGGFFRMTHHMDPVVQVPPASFVVDWHWQHVQPEVFYDGTVDKGYSLCARDGNTQCSSKYSNLLEDLSWVSDHLNYMDVHTSSSGCAHVSDSSNLTAVGAGAGNASRWAAAATGRAQDSPIFRRSVDPPSLVV